MRRYALIIAVATCIHASGAWATPTYQYVTDQSNYTYTPGASVPVNVFLQETIQVGDTSLLQSEGMFGVGVRVKFNEPTVPAHPAVVSSTSNITPNAGLDVAPFTVKDVVAGVSAGLSGAIPISGSALSPTGGPLVYKTLIGQFLFTTSASALPGEVTHVKAMDYDATDSNVTNTTLTSLDSLISTSNFTLTAAGSSSVPEPGSLLLVGVVGAGAMGYRRWRRRHAEPAVVAAE